MLADLGDFYKSILNEWNQIVKKSEYKTLFKSQQTYEQSNEAYKSYKSQKVRCSSGIQN